MEYNEMIAARIVMLCDEHHMTLRELTKKCGMNPATIEHIMNGTCRKPRIQTIYKIAEAFGMTALEFLDYPAAGEGAEN